MVSSLFESASFISRVRHYGLSWILSLASGRTVAIPWEGYNSVYFPSRSHNHHHHQILPVEWSCSAGHSGSCCARTCRSTAFPCCCCCCCLSRRAGRETLCFTSFCRGLLINIFVAEPGTSSRPRSNLASRFMPLGRFHINMMLKNGYRRELLLQREKKLITKRNRKEVL